MPVHPHPVSMLAVAEMRREELLDQALHDGVARSAADHGADAAERSSSARAAASALRAVGVRLASKLATRIDLVQSAPGEPTGRL
jgi:hypothetical protein